MNILRSFTETVVTTPTDLFPISFEYDEKYDAVHVFLNDVAVEDLGYTVSQVNAVTIKVEPAITEGTVRIERETDIDKMMYIFDAGALFIDQNVDADFKQIVHSQQEVRDGFIKLRGDVLPLVHGLQEALQQAQEASEAAQEAADAAEEAAQVSRSADKVFDSSGITQQVINNGVDVPADLLAVPTPKANSRLFVRSVACWYTYKPTLTATPNGVTIVGKWEMDVQPYYWATWFAPQDETVNNLVALQTGYDYATTLGRPFIINAKYGIDGPINGNEKFALEIRSNSKLIFFPGLGKLKQLTTNTQGYDTIRAHNGVSNFQIWFPEIEGDRNTHDGTLGEWGYLITLYDCSKGLIKGANLYNAWGDGLMIGRRATYPTAKLPKDIVVEGLTVDNCRRNGLSLTGGENLTILNPTIYRTNGTAPQSGIDIEPEEADTATELSYLKNVRIHNATLIDNVEHFNILSNKKDRIIDVTFTGTTRFINTGVNSGSDKFSVYKYTNVIGNKQSGQVVFDSILWTTAKNSVEFALSSEVTGMNIIVNKLEFSDNVEEVNINWSGGVVTGIPWGGIEFRNIIGKGLKRAAQSKFFITSNKENLKVGAVFQFPSYVDWVVGSDDSDLRVDTTSDNVNPACTRFGNWSTDTNKFSTYIRHVVHVDLSTPIYLRTGTDFRRLRIEFSKDIDVIGFGTNINGLLILGKDGNLKHEARCITPGGWIEFQNTPSGRTTIYGMSGEWVFS